MFAIHFNLAPAHSGLHQTGGLMMKIGVMSLARVFRQRNPTIRVYFFVAKSENVGQPEQRLRPSRHRTRKKS